MLREWPLLLQGWTIQLHLHPTSGARGRPARHLLACLCILQTLRSKLTVLITHQAYLPALARPWQTFAACHEEIAGSRLDAERPYLSQPRRATPSSTYLALLSLPDHCFAGRLHSCIAWAAINQEQIGTGPISGSVDGHLKALAESASRPHLALYLVMPSFSSDGPLSIASASPNSSVEGLSRKSNDRTVSGVFTFTNGGPPDARSQDYPKKDNPKPYKNNTLYSLPNGVVSGASKNGWEDAHSKIGSSTSIGSGQSQSVEQSRPLHGAVNGTSKLSAVETLEDGQADGVLVEPMDAHEQTTHQIDGEQTSPVSPVSHQKGAFGEDGPRSEPHEEHMLAVGHRQHVPPLNRFSPPAGMSPNAASSRLTPNHASTTHPPLTHRHTLQVPKATTTGRTSRDFSFTGGPSEEALSTGRFSPTHGEHPHRRRGSLGLIRRTTRSMQSDAHLDEIPQDEDALRWTEAIRQKRASKRKRREEEDDDRVIVGTKVDQGHVNWVTAYNMLTGIRFTVSRTNAKLDRALTDAEFTARHKFSFDVTGNELTPSAKYDFKFKDYAPWVFRRLRAHFGLDPADYLMSLTSKYILSELGSPGKSGSFFYFSRDYKYIIKTIHHAEHKLLRKILKDYYNHMVDNPNTLISQFYGLHRVKIPYGRKIHFVIMNNLFPPHRDIHQMFDLKGSTVGRDFKEEDLETNPRATLKDLNWLRRDLHLEFNHNMKEVFVEQVRRDVSLLQKLHIMDYSLLVGVHDLGKGNDENLREATLKVYQPGGERETEESMSSNMLIRTPSKMENARKARQLRLTLKKEKPVPMGLVQAKMPDELLDDERTNQVFYSNDGGVRASHENGEPGEKIYYLGIIDCLTHVSAGCP